MFCMGGPQTWWVLGQDRFYFQFRWPKSQTYTPHLFHASVVRRHRMDDPKKQHPKAAWGGLDVFTVF